MNTLSSMSSFQLTTKRAELYPPPASWRLLNYGAQIGPTPQVLSIFRVDDYNVWVASGFNIWKYNGRSWALIGQGNSNVWCIHSYDNGQTLFIIGQFTTMSGVSCNYVAKYNGITWSALGSGLNNAGRSSIYAVDASNIFICGQVMNSNNQNIQKYNSTNNTWTPLNTIGEIYKLQYYNSILYMAGSNGIVYKYNINTSAWSTMGTSLGNLIFGLCVLDENTAFVTGYVGNWRWNGSSWISMGGGGGNEIVALDANNIFLGAGSPNYLYKWNGTSWSTFAGGTRQLVYAIVPTSANSAYAGGDFGTSGGVGAGIPSFGVAYYV